MKPLPLAVPVVSSTVSHVRLGKAVELKDDSGLQSECQEKAVVYTDDAGGGTVGIERGTKRRSARAKHTAATAPYLIDNLTYIR